MMSLLLSTNMLHKSTLYLITLLAAAFLAVVVVLSIFKGMESAASTAIAALMTILSTYIWSQTKRPSKP